jgi:serine/threonine protein phosphatase PrpC
MVHQQLVSRPSIWVFAIFDGHGGKRCSTFCQRRLIGLIETSIQTKSTNVRLPLFLQSVLTQLSTEWDDHVFGDGIAAQLYESQAQRDSFYKSFDLKRHAQTEGDSGTTATVVLIDTCRRIAVLANCGDSRAVVSRTNSSSLISTKDHVVPLNIMVKNFSKVHIEDERVENDLAMARSIGDHCPTLSGVISREIDVEAIPIKTGACIVLGSDGLWDIYSNPEVFVNNETASQLIERRRDRVDDNISVMVIDVN